MNDERETSLADRLLGDVRHDLGDAWETVLSPADRQLVETCVADYAGLQLDAMAVKALGSPDEARIVRELGHVKAQLKSIRAAVQVGLVDKFVAAAHRQLARGMQVVFATI